MSTTSYPNLEYTLKGLREKSCFVRVFWYCFLMQSLPLSIPEWINTVSQQLVWLIPMATVYSDCSPFPGRLSSSQLQSNFSLCGSNHISQASKKACGGITSGILVALAKFVQAFLLQDMTSWLKITFMMSDQRTFTVIVISACWYCHHFSVIKS